MPRQATVSERRFDAKPECFWHHAQKAAQPMQQGQSSLRVSQGDLCSEDPGEIFSTHAKINERPSFFSFPWFDLLLSCLEGIAETKADSYRLIGIVNFGCDFRDWTLLGTEG